MFAPEDSANLYPVQFDSAGLAGDLDYYTVLDDTIGRLSHLPVEKGSGGDGKIYAAVNNARPNHRRFPKFREAKATSCTIRHIPLLYELV